MAKALAATNQTTDKTPFILKHLLAPLLVLMIAVGSLAAPAEAQAASRPTATYYGSTTRYVSRGGKLTFLYCLRSNSYGYRYGYRSRFDTDMYKANGRHVDYTNYAPYSGQGYHTVRYTFYRSRYSRNTWYKMRYRTQYRTSAYSGRWYTNTSKWINVKVW